MNRRSKFLFRVTALSLLLILSVPIASAEPALKVDVCHLDADSGKYHLINISDNAYPAHVDHGDGLPGDPIPSMEGYKFGGDCTPELIQITTTMRFYDWFDLETGKTFPENFPGEPPNTFVDLSYFPSNPYALISSNWYNLALFAYSDEPFIDVDYSDIASLSFEPWFFLKPFDKVVVILTSDGNYYKLGYISAGICAEVGGLCISFKWTQLTP